jgi:hypothetical protein
MTRRMDACVNLVLNLGLSALAGYAAFRCWGGWGAVCVAALGMWVRGDRGRA